MSDELISISDRKGETVARILPRRGMNCVSLVVRHQGRPLEILWTAPDFVSGQARATSSGIPLLFPFPGRLKGTSYTFSGRRYELEAGDALGNALHGFVFSRPWRVLEHTESRLLGQFTASQDAPEILPRWPTDFQLTANFEIAENRLALKIEVANVGRGPLPFGLGMHPYFRVPLGGSDATACTVTVPVEKCWELRDMLPTGKTTSAAEAGLSREGVRFGDAHFDHVFTGVVFHDGVATARIHDPGSGRTLILTFDRNFRECIVYTPPHRDAICIEPYTCVPDAYRLYAEGHHDTGLRVLAPGERLSAGMEIRIE